MQLLDSVGLILILALMVLFSLRGFRERSSFYLIIAAATIFFVSFLDVLDSEAEWTYLLYEPLQVLFGPALYVYILGVRGQRLARKTGWIHLLLPIVNCAVAGYYLLMPEETIALFYESTLYLSLLFVNILSITAYGMLMIISHFRHKWERRGKVSNAVQWSGTLIVAYIVLSLINFTYLFVYTISDEPEWLWMADSVVSLSIVLVLFFDGLRLGILTFRKPADTDEDENEKWEQLFERLDRRILKDALYLNPTLRIEDLARLMSTNTRYISKAVNVVYGDSVTNYLNEFRLRLFKEKLRDAQNDNLTIDALAMDCGFNSKSSANRFFKAKEGMTPSEWRRKRG